MSDEYILDDVVETFSDEDTLMSDIRNNPVKWLLSLAVVGPGMAYTITEQTSYASAMENWGLILFAPRTLMLDADASDSERWLVINVVAHELAHQVNYK